MPGHQHHDHRVDSINKARPTHLELPQQPTGRPRSPGPPRSPRSALSPSPDPSRRHRKKRVKNVRWDPSVVDNEHKMKSRDQKAVPVEHPSKLSARPSEQPTSSKSATANSSAKISSSATRQQPDSSFIQCRRPISSPPPQHSRAHAHHPTQAPFKAYSASQRASSSIPMSPTKTRKAPPAVPDAPRSYPPPPAPRPARLPTPDLPEIEESKFFVPKDKLFDYSRGRNNPTAVPVHLKADTQCR